MEGQSDKWMERAKFKLRVARFAVEIVLAVAAFLVFLFLSVIHTLSSELVKAFILYNLTMASLLWMTLRAHHLLEMWEMRDH
ncbi:hypothetical protein L2750_02210 [Shewanella submarina]|uniref:Chlorhexidine efflux transporter domain-containing protein n=1 Tax=Shewanella submarina TaxID=2016376 RepID=A0ABV7GJ41_9GAMM|nr:hypothetical protein [Shewanella submarina]MCL1035974.1 hypothetical protein [Shewanella submarina]